MQLTILFQPPYWVGVLEVVHADQLLVARHIFGAEPNDAEIYDFVQRDLVRLMQTMTHGIALDPVTPERRPNPKRLQRDIKRAIAEQGISSKAQAALRLQIEAGKTERKQQTRAERDAEREHKRQSALAKAKARHKGH